MARIPKLSPSISVSQDVPRAELSRIAVGATEVAMAQIGGTVANLGLEIVKQRTAQEATNYSNDQDQEYRDEYASLQRQLAKKGGLSDDGFLISEDGRITETSYAQRMNILTEQFRQRGLDEAPTRLARDTFQRSFAPVATIKILQADNAFNNMRISSELRRSKERGDSKALALLQLPLVDSNTGQVIEVLEDSAADSINQIRKEFFVTEVFKHLSKQQIDEEFKKQAKKVGDVYFDRVLRSNSPIEVQRAINLINRDQTQKDFTKASNNTIIKTGFSPKQLSIMETRLKDALEGMGKQNLSELSKISNNLITTMRTSSNTVQGKLFDGNNLNANIEQFKLRVVSSEASANKKLELLAPVIAAKLQFDSMGIKFGKPIREWERSIKNY